MCFNYETEWCAMHVEDATAPATKPTWCDECHQLVHAGEPLRHVYQQEREDGEYCGPDDDEHVDGCDGTDCEHEGPGETFEWDCCERCDKLLRVIKQVELAEGCGEHESQPRATELRQAMRDDDHYSGGHYADYAREAFPELADGYLDRMATPDADAIFERLANPDGVQFHGRPHGPYAWAEPEDDRPRYYEHEHGGEG